MITSDQTFQQIPAAATPEERAEQARVSADRLIEAIADDQAAADARAATPVTLALTAAEADTLRFILGVIASDDFESDADAANYETLCAKVGA